MAEQTSQQRAEQAAEELAAEGAVVTARTVRQRARVDMGVAAAAARAWKGREAQAREVPAVPDQVLARMEAVWRAAIESARDEHEAERDGWAARIKAAEDESRALAEEVDRAEGERDEAREAARIEGDQLRARITELEKEVTRDREAAEKAVAGAAAGVQEANARAAAAEGVAAGLREALATLTQKGE